MPYRYLFALVLMFSACGPEPPKPPRPLDISGIWELVNATPDPVRTTDAGKALALYEQHSKWIFDGKGALNIGFFKKKVRWSEANNNYEWLPKEKLLKLSGSVRFNYDIKYHTNDSLSLYNQETAVTYEFVRDQFGKPSIPKDSTLVPPPLDSTLIPHFDGKWELAWLRNPLITHQRAADLGEISEGQIWDFGLNGRFSIQMGGKTAQGKWEHLPSIEKLLITMDNHTIAYRVISLARQAMSIESTESGNTIGFKKKK